MIRPNVPSKIRNTKAHPKTTKREFTGILAALRPFWDQYLADPEAHTARGMLGTRTGVAYTADMSFDEDKRHISLIVRLPLDDELDTPRMHVLLRFQSHSQGLAFVTFDAEQRALLLVSRSVLPSISTAEQVAACVVADALSILEDEGLKKLVN